MFQLLRIDFQEIPLSYFFPCCHIGKRGLILEKYIYN